MGQAANDAVTGQTCSWCGIFFVKPHGHPVICIGCWKYAKPSERAGNTKAYLEEL